MKAKGQTLAGHSELDEGRRLALRPWGETPFFVQFNRPAHPDQDAP